MLLSILYYKVYFVRYNVVGLDPRKRREKSKTSITFRRRCIQVFFMGESIHARKGGSCFSDDRRDKNKYNIYKHLTLRNTPYYYYRKRSRDDAAVRSTVSTNRSGSECDAENSGTIRGWGGETKTRRAENANTRELAWCVRPEDERISVSLSKRLHTALVQPPLSCHGWARECSKCFRRTCTYAHFSVSDTRIILSRTAFVWRIFNGRQRDRGDEKCKRKYRGACSFRRRQSAFNDGWITVRTIDGFVRLKNVYYRTRSQWVSSFVRKS
jgi:hypothetical protein